MSWNGTSVVARAALVAVVFGIGVGMNPALGGSPDFVGAQLDLAYPGNTHNNDNHEASSELMTGGEVFVGWDLAPWAAIQANLGAHATVPARLQPRHHARIRYR
jgi:hypothetical protein